MAHFDVKHDKYIIAGTDAASAQAAQQLSRLAGSFNVIAPLNASGIVTLVGVHGAKELFRDSMNKRVKAFVIDFSCTPARYQTTDDNYWAGVLSFFRLLPESMHLRQFEQWRNRPPTPPPRIVPAASTTTNDPRAVLSIVLGILGVLFSLCPVFGLLFSIPAIVVGCKALRGKKRAPSQLAPIGIAVGCVGVIVSVIALAIMLSGPFPSHP